MNAHGAAPRPRPQGRLPGRGGAITRLAGKRRRTVVPRATALSMSRAPPCASTRALVTARPRATPFLCPGSGAITQVCANEDDFHGKGAAVLASPHALRRRLGLPVECRPLRMPAVLAVRHLRTRRQQHVKRRAEEFVRRVAEHALGAGVDENDPLRLVDRDHRVGKPGRDGVIPCECRHPCDPPERFAPAPSPRARHGPSRPEGSTPRLALGKTFAVPFRLDRVCCTNLMGRKANAFVSQLPSHTARHLNRLVLDAQGRRLRVRQAQDEVLMLSLSDTKSAGRQA